MGFSAKQVQALRRKLDGRQIRTREANGRELSYIEGWYAISEANRIFGFDGWSRETVELPLRSRPGKPRHLCGRLCRQSADHGPGRWRNRLFEKAMAPAKAAGTSPGEVHDIALKAAETDATKRAFATFGKPFGLELYRQSRTSGNLPVAATHAAAPPALGFIPMTRRQFHVRRSITAVGALLSISCSLTPSRAAAAESGDPHRRSRRM